MATPFIPTPQWLDPATEIKEPDQPLAYQRLSDEKKAVAFILNSLKGIFVSGATISLGQALEVIGNSIVETGWGRHHRGRNFGGWKIRKADVDRARAAGLPCPPWWKAMGHVKSGDQPFVYYRGFSSVDKFYSEWLNMFVPKASSPSHRYHKTGRVFWGQESGDWFLELCLAGYKGDVTKANPQGSVRKHKEVVEGVKVRLIQHFLGLEPDGVWGTKSTAKCVEYQQRLNLPQTGRPDQVVLSLMVETWRAAGMPLFVEL